MRNCIISVNGKQSISKNLDQFSKAVLHTDFIK